MTISTTTTHVLEAVAQERARQDGLWGEQNHESGLWALILGEEFGEACKSSLQVRFDMTWADTGMTEEEYRDILVKHLRSELIQVAAVSVAWVEAIDREKEAR